MDYTTQRLDRYLRKKYGIIPQSVIEKAIRNKDILVNDKKVRSSERISDNDKVYVHPNIERLFNNLSLSVNKNKNISVNQKHLDLFKKIIIYEDDDLLIVNKPGGMAVQLGSKINIALDVIAKAYNSELRLVHRIDKETSGITIFAKNLESARYMLEQFKSKQVNKTYVALLSRKVLFKNKTIRVKLLKEKDKVIIDNIRGKPAVTEFTFVANVSGKSLIIAKPLTGRTHQIRVHLASINAPILGDRKYGSTANKHLYLHAYEIVFKQYRTGNGLHIKAPLPEYFKIPKNILE